MHEPSLYHGHHEYIYIFGPHALSRTNEMWIFNASYAARVPLSITYSNPQPHTFSVTVAPSALPSITGVCTLTGNVAGMRVGCCVGRKGRWWVRRGMDGKRARGADNVHLEWNPNVTFQQQMASGQSFIVAGCAMVMMSVWHGAIFELRPNPAAEAPDWPQSRPDPWLSRSLKARRLPRLLKT
ncbi:hypothetical protein BDR06DRAFT_999404, partial [Suillus hirtellus]